MADTGYRCIKRVFAIPFLAMIFAGWHVLSIAEEDELGDYGEAKVRYERAPPRGFRRAGNTCGTRRFSAITPNSAPLHGAAG